MVRVVRTPDVIKRNCTPEQLSGWATGFAYTPRRKKRKRKVEAEPSDPTPAPAPVKLSIGLKIS